MPNGLIETLLHSLLIIGQNLELNFHLSQLPNHSFPLNHMLRFIFLTGFSTPADHQQHWNWVDFFMSQRHYRIYYISQARVLQVHNWEFVSCQVVTAKRIRKRGINGSYIWLKMELIIKWYFNYYPAAMPIADPSLAEMTWFYLGLWSETYPQKSFNKESGTPV